MYSIYSHNDERVYVGTVVEPPKRQVENGCMAVDVLLEDKDGKRVIVRFRNAPRGSKKQAMLADRVLNSRVASGHFLCVYAKCSPSENVVYGLDFKYRGAWKFLRTGKPSTTVLLGRVYNATKVNDSMFSIQIPIGDSAAPSGAQWVDITFLNTDGKLNAKAAERMFQGKENLFAVVFGSGIRTEEKNGKVYYKMYGYRAVCK